MLIPDDDPGAVRRYSVPGLGRRRTGTTGRVMLVVDTSSSVPPFEQLRQQIAQQVADGTLLPGTQLPTVRRLAADLGLAPNTVARTYRELEQSGIVRTAGRRGTVVAEPAVDVAAEAQRTTDRFVATMRGLGVSAADAVQLVHRAYGG